MTSEEAKIISLTPFWKQLLFPGISPERIVDISVRSAPTGPLATLKLHICHRPLGRILVVDVDVPVTDSMLDRWHSQEGDLLNPQAYADALAADSVLHIE